VPDRINIPVTVTGAEQAKAELRGVVSGVQEVKQASANPYAQLAALRGEGPARRPGGVPGVEPERAASTAGPAVAAAAAEQQALAATTEQMTRAGAAAEVAAGKKQLFTRHARVLAATLLGEVSPAMGGMVNLFSQIALGIGEMTAGLVALAGGAALLGGLIMVFKELAATAQRYADALERAERARRGAREAGGEERERIRAAAAAVGVVGDTSLIQANARAQEQAENIPPAIAENLALAQILSRRRRRPFHPDEYLAGILAGGGEPPKLEGMEAIATIQETLARGRSAEARAAAKTWKWELKQEAPTVPPPGGERIAAIDTAMAERRGEMDQRGLVENEIAAIRRMAAELPADLDLPSRLLAARKKGILPTWSNWSFRDLYAREAGLGGAATNRELVEWANQIVPRALARGAALGAVPEPDTGIPRPAVATTQPITINVHNDNRQTTNMDAGYFLGGGPREQYGAYETQHEGAGIEN